MATLRMKFMTIDGMGIKYNEMNSSVTRHEQDKDADRRPHEPYVRYRHTGTVYRTGGHLESRNRYGW
jgi:hypothetical protein